MYGETIYSTIYHLNAMILISTISTLYIFIWVVSSMLVVISEAAVWELHDATELPTHKQP